MYRILNFKKFDVSPYLCHIVPLSYHVSELHRTTPNQLFQRRETNEQSKKKCEAFTKIHLYITQSLGDNVVRGLQFLSKSLVLIWFRKEA